MQHYKLLSYTLNVCLRPHTQDNKRNITKTILSGVCTIHLSILLYATAVYALLLLSMKIKGFLSNRVSLSFC